MLGRVWRPAIRLVRPFTEALKLRLTPHQYYITQGKGAERPFTGKYWDHSAHGGYHCVACRERLFSSVYKFESELGFAGFCAPEENKVTVVASDSAKREVKCTKVSST